MKDVCGGDRGVDGVKVKHVLSDVVELLHRELEDGSWGISLLHCREVRKAVEEVISVEQEIC